MSPGPHMTGRRDSMKRATFAILLAIVLLGGLWWWSSASRSRSDQPLMLEEHGPARAIDSTEVLPPEKAASLDSRASVSVVGEAPAQGASPSEPSIAKANGGIGLSGTIVVLDDQGLEYPSENGHFEMVPMSGHAGTVHTVDVVSGAWSVDLPERAGIDSIKLGEFVLRNRPAFLLEDALGSLPAVDNRAVLLRVRWPADSLLHVRDRASGRELEHVMLVSDTSNSWSSIDHPGDSARAAQDLGRSPLRLQPPVGSSSTSRDVYARSPGYAWGRIELDDTHGGERFLLLDPGGDLEIQLVGKVDDPNAKLRLYGLDSQPVFELDLSGQTALQVSGLHAGEHRLVAEIGDYWDEPLNLGEVPALIRAHETCRVVLALRAPPPISRVRCGGTLVLPLEWDLDDFSLEFELLGTPLGGGDGRFDIESFDMEVSPERPTERKWTAPDVQPGLYEVLLRDLAFTVVLDIPPPGVLDARIEVPAPTWVEVVCVDDSTGVAIEKAEVEWHFKLPEEVSGWSDEEAEWDVDLLCFRFRAPIGLVTISAGCEGYASTSKTVQVVQSENKFELRVRKQCGVKPVLRDGDTVIPWGLQAGIELEPVEGQQNEHASTTWGGGVVTLNRGEPGLYVLRIPLIPGYLPVPEQTIRLETGVVTEHVVHLIRAQ